MAILTRFLVGAANGNSHKKYNIIDEHALKFAITSLLHHCSIGIVGTGKAVVSELSDDSTQSLGVSIISTSWGMGFIIGPAISGAISDPIGQYNLNITSKRTDIGDLG